MRSRRCATATRQRGATYRNVPARARRAAMSPDKGPARLRRTGTASGTARRAARHTGRYTRQTHIHLTLPRRPARTFVPLPNETLLIKIYAPGGRAVPQKFVFFAKRKNGICAGCRMLLHIFPSACHTKTCPPAKTNETGDERACHSTRHPKASRAAWRKTSI